MQPKLLRRTQAEFIATEWTGENTSGLIPLDDAVLVMADKAADQSSGGIFLPDNINDRHSQAAETGVVVALGDGAFTWGRDRARPFTGRTPVPGDRVHFERYAGFIEFGKDGLEYRLMADKLIVAIEA